MTIEEEIKRLVAIRYMIVGCQHHKDRDCHYEVSRKFSYGGFMEWKVEHYGYHEDFHETFDSEGGALVYLRDKLKELVVDYIETRFSFTEEEWGWADDTETNLEEISRAYQSLYPLSNVE